MSERRYDHLAIEKKWQERWLDGRVFSVTAPSLPLIASRSSPSGRGSDVSNVYVLDMFPYPSGDGLHVGHPEGYTATDIYSRYLRMNGKNVLHPMGWDAFGLPAENAAIKKGIHPRIVTEQNVKNFKRQIQSIGFSYDWDREINTTDPKYYKWTQWIFLQLFKRGLAYEAELPIWWCPKDKTGLANEEVVNGCCERCGTKVERKMLRQWVLKITAYAERLLKGLDRLDWPESIKALQRNWIGRSEGATVKFQVPNSKLQIEVFTTRPDTLFGTTYLVLSPEHPLVDEITVAKQKKAVAKYKKEVASKSDLERTALEKEKTGVFTGAYAENPVNNEKIPVWIADYVLMSYGTGAIMAVPAHDERDFEFSKKFDLRAIPVINGGRNVVLIHGCPDSEEARDPKKRTYDKHWMPWIKAELEKTSTVVQAPLMPTPWAPVYEEWKREFEKLPISENTILIAHSCGSTFAVRWLGETKKKIAGLVLVAPWKDESHKNPVKKSFYTYPIDSSIANRVDEIAIFSSDNENEDGREFARKFHKAIGGKFIKLPKHGHFTMGDMGTQEFPELLEVAQGMSARCYTGEGTMANSEQFDGLPSEEGRKKIVAWLEKQGKAKPAVQYKLRDWVFSRQRYWGEPIPLIHCEHCREVVESTPWVLNFYERAWKQIQSGEKVVETRALNPNEPDRYFGDIKVGDIIKGVLKGTNETMYLKIKNRYQFNNLEELLAREDVVNRIGSKDTEWTLEKLKKAYAFTPDYIERIEKNGMVGWEIKRIWPGVIPLKEENLPLELPNVEKYEPTGTGESPLAAIDEWVNVKCRVCGHPAKRETNTMPQWAGSCWYYIRFCDPHNDEAMASAEAMKAWLPVDLYVGGAEHAVLHLLYARFWHMVLYDVGAIPPECGDEPFMKLKNQGLILGPDGEKMSKSRGNVINPDEIIAKYGADTLRMYEMFMGPFEDAKPWDTNGIVGVKRFLEKIARNAEEKKYVFEEKQHDRWHNYVKQISEGIENFRFNTCVSDFMKWVNEWGMGVRGFGIRGESRRGPWDVGREEFEVFLKVLSPFAPHIAEELWSRLGHDTLLAQEQWPKLDPKKIIEETVTIAVQVIGKLRGTITVNSGASQAEVERLAKTEPNVAKYLTKEPKKVIFVKDKLINFVV